MSFLYLFLVGILIGSAMIVPGVSGSVIAVIFGLYDKGINALINLFKDFKNNFLFLFFSGLGILIGAVWFGNVLLFLYSKNESLTRFSFIGLIMGGIPYLIKTVHKKDERISYLAILISIIISAFFLILSKNIISVSNNYSLINLFLSGFIYSFGKVIPGISGSFLLMTIGMYNFVLLVISHPITYALHNMNKVIPFLFGLILGTLVLINIINILLKKYFGIIYSLILGFVIIGIISLIPINISINTLLLGLIIMIISFLLSYLLLKST